ncbi:hypothetical protein SLE2022_150780 [Rubroshorea leprosula]
MHLGENIDSLRDLEEEEEVLSLCELPLDNEEYDEKGVGKTGTQARLSSETTEFFSFLSDLSIDMCPADDIIFCGKLVPLKDQHVVQPQRIRNSFKDDKRSSFGYRKRSESLSDLQSTTMSRSDSMTSDRVLRNSRSLDYQKLHRMLSSNSSSPDPSMDRNSSGRSLGKSDANKKAVMKPRWYVLMFGMLKFPPEMELKDIKNRQFRRIPSVMFPPVLDDSKKPPPNRSSGKTAWRFLKALSCRDPTSIETTPSFCMPHA